MSAKLRRIAVGLLALVCLLGATNRSTFAQDYQLDGAHSSLVFGVDHLGLATVFGRFNKVSGQYRFDPEQAAASQFKVEIEVDSVDTNNVQRDEHLKSPDFFDANQFPKIVFESTGVTSEQDANGKTVLNVRGKMTLHGVTRDVTLPIRYNGSGKGPAGNDRTGFTTTFQIKRSEYGMKNMVPNIGDSIGITFSFEGVLQP